MYEECLEEYKCIGLEVNRVSCISNITNSSISFRVKIGKSGSFEASDTQFELDCNSRIGWYERLPEDWLDKLLYLWK